MKRRRSRMNSFDDFDGLVMAVVWVAVAVCAVVVGSALTMFDVFWLIGVWIPWFIAIFGIAVGWLVWPLWVVLLIAHSFPKIHWPIF